jgi:hypothetical protein
MASLQTGLRELHLYRKRTRLIYDFFDETAHRHQTYISDSRLLRRGHQRAQTRIAWDGSRSSCHFIKHIYTVITIVFLKHCGLWSQRRGDAECAPLTLLDLLGKNFQAVSYISPKWSI